MQTTANVADNNRIVFLRGRQTILRPLNVETDLEIVTRWVNDPDVRQYVGVNWPMSLAAERAWFEQRQNDQNNLVLGIETLDGRLIGVMNLHGLDRVNRQGTTGALLGEKAYWGKGLGSDAKMALLEYAFMVLNLRRINSEVIAYNKRSLKYSLKCGYKVEGVIRQVLYRKGRYWNRYQLGLLKSEWLPVWRHYKKTGELLVPKVPTQIVLQL
jgi:RimJ/RimL family protein N-acetyltransferase